MNYEEREENKARALADFARRAGKPEEVITAVEAGVSIHEIESLLRAGAGPDVPSALEIDLTFGGLRVVGRLKFEYGGE